jgi:glycosyltransferase involved in cell wall biosynthesis
VIPAYDESVGLLSKARAVPAMREIVTTVPPDIEALDVVPSRPGLALHVVNRRDHNGAALLRRLVREGRRSGAVLLNGSGRLDQLAAAALRRSSPRTKVVISDSTWDIGTNTIDRLACRLGIRALDGANVTYCVLSTHEVTAFPEQWGVDPKRVRFTPFCHTLDGRELAEPLRDGQGVFAGGDSMRDYEPLLQAAGELGCRVTLAVRRPDELGPLPANVHAARVAHREFLTLMRNARIVVVPLRAGIGRSAGQQTYLNAMALGKVVVVTDSPGARDHVTDRADGFIVPAGDARALVETLRWIDDPRHSEEVGRVRANAVRTARERFTPAHHLSALLEVVAEVVGADEVEAVER